jgi:pimeloyl-ACP methyl ester carboxylesterase
MFRSEACRFDGLSVPVEIWGGDGRPLVFLPGLGAHPAYYHDGLRRLARHFTVFVPDLSFRTHTALPESVAGYQAVAESLADRYAPGAPWAGHSFGGLIALLGSRVAIALSPMVPLTVSWPANVGRAVLLQLFEYLGLEGRRGPGWAWGIMCDYLRTSVRHPRCLFPAVSETLHCFGDLFRPSAPLAHVLLARFDWLYFRREYDAFLAGIPRERIVVRRVRRGHDWPVTDPALLEREVLRAAGLQSETGAADVAGGSGHS